MYEPTALSLTGLVVIIIGFIILNVFFTEEGSLKDLGMSVLVLILGVVLLEHPAWNIWYLFFKNAVAAVPTWARIVAGLMIYSTLNHIYVAWLFYAEQHPNGLAAKIIYPWPLGEVRHSNNPIDLYVYGTMIFVIWWLVTIVSYSGWIIFGGGIAKLLHLLPREPHP